MGSGYSIINRTATADIGSLLLRYGGGGHRAVGTCRVAHEDAERVIAELVGAFGGIPEPQGVAVPVAAQAWHCPALACFLLLHHAVADRRHPRMRGCRG